MTIRCCHGQCRLVTKDAIILLWDSMFENPGTGRRHRAYELDALSRYDGLQSIRLTALGAYVLGLTGTYQPSNTHVIDAAPLKVLSNLDIVATGDIPTPLRLLVCAYTKQINDRVWTVSATSLLSALDSGRDLTEFTTFLTQHTKHDLPSTLSTLIADVQRRAGQLTDLGHARVIECADPATAALIANDPNLNAG